jgi:hypothetical protein
VIHLEGEPHGERGIIAALLPHRRSAMKRTLRLFACSLPLLFACAPPRESVDLLLHHGKIVTVDESGSIHSAVAMRDGKIVAVGGDDLAELYEAARSIDLAGKTVVPGFNDTHIHIRGQAARSVDLREVKSLVEIKQKVAAKAKELGPNEWVTGWGWSEDDLAEKRRPLRGDLDQAAPENPVILTRAGGHSSVANSRALELAGVTRDTPDPEGGVIETDEKGELNGVIRERAQIVSRLVPEPTREELRGSFVQNLRDLLRLGITSIVHAGASFGEFAEWEEVYRTLGEELPRASVQIRWAGVDEMKRFGRKTGEGDERLRVGAIKVVVDGGFTGPAAYTSEPYRGQPGFRGKLNLKEEELEEIVKDAHAMGWQLGFHAIGDAAIVLTIDAFEKAIQENPRPNHRHYLNHFTVPPPAATLDKMVANEIWISQQPNFTYTLEGRYVDYLDGDRLEHNNPVATPMSRGIFMAISSDILPIGPMVGIYAAVTRKGKSGRVFAEEEKVSVAEALEGYTRNAAYFTFEEDLKGTIEPGKLADMAVLSDDLLTIDPEKILNVQVDMTILGGRVVYERGGASPTEP